MVVSYFQAEKLLGYLTHSHCESWNNLLGFWWAQPGRWAHRGQETMRIKPVSDRIKIGLSAHQTASLMGHLAMCAYWAEERCGDQWLELGTVLFFLGLAVMLLWPESGTGENMWWPDARESCILRHLALETPMWAR